MDIIEIVLNIAIGIYYTLSALFVVISALFVIAIWIGLIYLIYVIYTFMLLWQEIGHYTI